MNNQNASLLNGVEPILIDDWHVIADLEFLNRVGHHRTRLFDVPISIDYQSNVLSVIRTDSNVELTHRKKYGYFEITTPTNPGNVSTILSVVSLVLTVVLSYYGYNVYNKFKKI